MRANMLRGVPLYNSSGERFFETLQPAQVSTVICLQFNRISMFNSALEKMEHLSRKNFGTNLGKSWKELFLGQ